MARSRIYALVHQGSVIFLLLQGRVRLYRVADGWEITLNVMGAGPSEVVLMSRDTFHCLVRDRPKVGLKATEILSKRLSFCEDRRADIGLKEVPARLAALVLHLCKSEGVVTGEGYKIPTRYTHQQLGEMVGAKRVAATRALGKLRRIGAVEFKQRHIYVKDVKVLQQVAGK